MFADLNEQLAELKAKKRQQNNVTLRLEALEAELQEAKQLQAELQRVWLKERRDVERLQGFRFGALLLSLIGKREERLSREEAEMLQAKWQLEEAEDTVQDLLAEREELQRLSRQLSDVDTKIAAVLADKEALIRAHHPELAAALHELTEREAEEGANAKELQEAVTAGRRVLGTMERIEQHLQSARNWGIYDMLGGGIISTAIKHSRIDEARSALHAAQADLKRFRSELQDVARDVHLQLDMGNLLTFGDYLFDGLVMDWIVQGRIDGALDKARQQSARIRRVVRELEQALDHARNRLDQLANERRTRIRQA